MGDTGSERFLHQHMLARHQRLFGQAIVGAHRSGDDHPIEIGAKDVLGAGGGLDPGVADLERGQAIVLQVRHHGDRRMC